MSEFGGGAHHNIGPGPGVEAELSDFLVANGVDESGNPSEYFHGGTVSSESHWYGLLVFARALSQQIDVSLHSDNPAVVPDQTVSVQPIPGDPEAQEFGFEGDILGVVAEPTGVRVTASVPFPPGAPEVSTELRVEPA